MRVTDNRIFANVIVRDGIATATLQGNRIMANAEIALHGKQCFGDTRRNYHDTPPALCKRYIVRGMVEASNPQKSNP